MKRNYLLALGVVLLLGVTSCGPKRYGCNKKRCISYTEQTTKKVTRDV